MSNAIVDNNTAEMPSFDNDEQWLCLNGRAERVFDSVHAVESTELNIDSPEAIAAAEICGSCVLQELCQNEVDKWQKDIDTEVHIPTPGVMGGLLVRESELGNKEALRIIKSTIGLWKPGISQGKPTSVRLSTVITFKLPEQGHSKETEGLPKSVKIQTDDILFENPISNAEYIGGQHLLLSFQPLTWLTASFRTKPFNCFITHSLHKAH